jgi:agmatinase
MKKEILRGFLDVPAEFATYEASKIVVLPVPFDRTSTWIKGADKGPKAILEASANLEYYDIETGSEIHRKGIYTEEELLAKNSEELFKKVYDKITHLLKDRKFVVTLGGEHSVSIGAIKAHADFFRNLSVLHLDAHSDRRDSYQNNRYSHACVMARVQEMVDKTVSVGVRSMDSSELMNIKKDAIFYAHEIHSSSKWMKKALGKLSKNVYVTLDLDVFDSGIMPSTGTPEPGGLGWYQVLEFLKLVSKNKNIVGFDVVELCPSPANRAPDALAAKLIISLLCYKFSGKQKIKTF